MSPVDQVVTHGQIGAGLTSEEIVSGIRKAYSVLDTMDQALLEGFGVRLSGVVEGANFSSIIGNLLALGIVEASDGRFEQAGAHKYQDLRAVSHECQNIEIKIALERNDPKGHLAKAGWYLTCRYVFADADGNYAPGERHDVPRIWEIRLGELVEEDFSISNTAGDSGKTANISKTAQRGLTLVYFDPRYCPYAKGPDWYLARYG
jgi:hypothetical protein